MKLAISPLGAVLRGLAAGTLGTLGMSLFWRLTAGRKPADRSDEYESPPEPIQRSEPSGQLVHYASGAGWGALYGIVRESVPWMRTPAGMAAFSGAVWAISEGVIRPGLELAPPLHAREVKNVGYDLGSHLIYGATTAAAYEALRPATWLLAGSWLGGKLMKRTVHKRAPELLQPVAEKLVDGTQYAIRKIASLPPLARSL